MVTKNRALLAAVLLGQALVPTPVSRADVIFASVNLNATPLASPTHGASEIGWAFVPSSSFLLSGVSTRFAAVDGRTVTFELRAVPASPNGTTPAEVVGPLLRTDDFLASSDPVSATTPQASFAPISLSAGTQYFLGFRGIRGLGQLVTNDLGAQHLGVPGASRRVFFGLSNTGTYSSIEDNSSGSAPILALYGPSPAAPIPEPSGLVLLGAAAVGTLLVRGRKARRAQVRP